MTLTGVNTYTGATNVSAGTFILSGAGSLSNVTALTVNGGTVFDMSAASGSRSVGSLAGAGDVLLGANTIITGGNNSSTTFSGVLSGSGGFTKTGNGTQLLSGLNTYTGATGFNGGILSVLSDANLGNGGALLFNGGTLQATGSFTTNRLTTLNAGGGVFDTAGAGVILTMDTNINGAGMLTKTGSGKLTLLGANTYSGGTTINNGIFALSGPGSINTSGAVVMTGGIFDISATDIGAIIGSLSGAGDVLLGSRILTTGDGGDTTFSGVISGLGSLVKQGAGAFTLLGSNTYSGGTTVSVGTLQGNTQSLQGDILNNAAVIFDQSSDGTYAGIMSGTGSLNKWNTGTLTLTGLNTYSGGTTINNGIFALSGPGALNTSGAVAMTGGAFDISAANIGATIGSLSGAGEVVLGSRILTTGDGGDTTFSGVISGLGSLVKQGAGAFTLLGSNTYSGGTTVSVGTLQGNTQSLQGDILNNAAVIFDQSSDGTYAGNLSGIGTLVKTNSGALYLTGDNSLFSGDTTVDSGDLFVNTTLGGGSLSVNSGAFLRGSGIVPTTTVLDGGTLAPGNSIDTINISGDITFDPLSVYLVESQAYGPSDLTVATGTATILGGLVDARATGTLRYRAINTYTILTADGGVSGVFSNVTSDLDYLDPSLLYDPNNVYLFLRRNDVDFGRFGTLGNQNGVAQVLNRLIPTATGQLMEVINNIYDLSSDDALHAMDSMIGTHYLYVPNGHFMNTQMFLAANIARLEQVTGTSGNLIPATGLAVNRMMLADAGTIKSDAIPLTAAASPGTLFAGEKKIHNRLWARGLYGEREFKSDNPDPDFETTTRGVVIGLDEVITENFILGASGAYTRHQVDQDNLFDSTEYHMGQLGMYGRFSAGPWYVDSVFGLSRQDYTTHREVTDGVNSAIARGDYGGEGFSSQIESGYSFNLAKGLTFVPQVGLQYSLLSRS